MYVCVLYWDIHGNTYVQMCVADRNREKSFV